MNPADEMVARLNDSWQHSEGLCEEAAELIRSLAAERDTLAFELKRRPTFDTRPTHTEIAAANYKTKDAERRATTAEAENAVLRSALEPFAEFAEDITTNHPGWDHDEFAIFIGDHPLKLAPFRRARAAIGGEQV